MALILEYNIMSLNKTHEEFMTELYNKNKRVIDDFDIISKYIGTHSKIRMISKYGKVEMDACKLLRGAYPSISSAINKTEYFINKAKSIHGDEYDYSNMVYINSKGKVIITCRQHGDFLQEANAHLNGHGCKQCGTDKVSKIKTKKTEDFIKQSIVVHGDKYDYSNVDYTRNSKNVDIICPIHGEFKQQPANHLQGKGCSKCADVYYNIYSAIKYKDLYESQDGMLYIVKMYNKSESFYKVGITKVSIEKRFEKLKDYDYEIIRVINDNLFNVSMLEKYIHDEMSHIKYTPKILFGGHTECFCEIDSFIIDHCYENINEYISKIEKEVTYVTKKN